MGRETKSLTHRAYLDARAKVFALGLPAFANPEDPLPLKFGTRDDLAKIIGEDLTRDFLLLWTSRREYVAQVSRGGWRYDLQGKPVEEISEEDRLKAETAKNTAKAPRKSREIRPISTVAQANRHIRRLAKRLPSADEKRRRKIERQISNWERKVESGKLTSS